uniref:Large ribosomal subunit protein eL6 n=1 Tax=Hemiscolopendra marginata TaxID=943146 RepID=A0A646QEI6_9MYRI
MADTETKPTPKKAEGKGVVEKKDAKTKPKKPGKPRNYDLGNGVYRFSRSRMYKKRALYKKIKKDQTKKPKPKKPSLFVKKPIGGEKNGGFRLVRVKKLARYYPTEPKFKKPKTRKNNFASHKRFLRRSITPGTVLIIVAGKHRGKRVVFLKQLQSGLLLVTGPFKMNACPLRRINQIYVIATKTRLDISGVKIPKHLNDIYFKRKRLKRPKKDEGEIFETKKETYQISDQRKKDQIEMDKQVIEVIRKHPEKKFMFAYLGSMFCLRNHMYPHKMKF